MFARTCLTLTLCFTSTLAAAKEPAQRAEGPMPARLAWRATEPASPGTQPQEPGAPAGARQQEPGIAPQQPAATPGRQPQQPAATPGRQQQQSVNLTPATMRRNWETEHKWLQAGTAVSWVLVGLGTIGTIVPLTTLSRCNAADAAGADVDCTGERRTAAITTPIVGVLTLAALVPAIMFSTRLSRHKAERPTARLRVTPGGVALHF